MAEISLRVAFVVQRYGPEVAGGAEALCRHVAERLGHYADVHVLTTCALEYGRWTNYYSPGVTKLNQVTVHRFPVSKERNRRAFNRLSERLFSPGDRHDYPAGELEWMLAQGPRAETLLDHISGCRDEYDVFVFFTYLYYTTFFGVQLVPEKSVLVPTAHDEPPIYLEIFRPLFHIPRFIVFLTDEERDFVHRHFQNPHVPWAVVGTGIETPRDVRGERFRARYGLSEPFILYAGRISLSKNCNGLFEFFKRYKEETNASLKLVLIGRADMPIPEYADIVYLGFVREEDKFDGLQAAEVVVMPSRFESFSIVSLEALSVGTPVLVNGESLVLKEHCLRANGGLYYHSYEEFSLALTLLLEREDLHRRLGQQGAAYVSQFYPWSTIERRYLEILESVANGGEDWVR